ncbi:MAG TPA: serine O-acetyltransferase [Thermopetrobacter sp.]|nr:serine O-acetyltransferase [Thermopetrobacter sp.]
MSEAAQRDVRALDPVWRRIRKEAEEIIANDASLGGFIHAAVLNHARFGHAIGHRLAMTLANHDINAELIVQAYTAALKADPAIGRAARADILAVHERDPACERLIEPFLYFKGFQALQAHRLAHALWNIGRRDFALFLQSRASQVFSVDIHPAAKMGQGIMIDHAHAIVIGETAVVEDNVSILQDVTLGGTGKEDGDRHPKIREGVLLGAGCKVLGNIEVGRCSKVASGSVVLKDVPEKSVVAGVPARVVGKAECACEETEAPARVMDHRLNGDDEDA